MQGGEKKEKKEDKKDEKKEKGKSEESGDKKQKEGKRKIKLEGTNEQLFVDGSDVSIHQSVSQFGPKIKQAKVL